MEDQNTVLRCSLAVWNHTLFEQKLNYFEHHSGLLKRSLTIFFNKFCKIFSEESILFVVGCRELREHVIERRFCSINFNSPG